MNSKKTKTYSSFTRQGVRNLDALGKSAVKAAPSNFTFCRHVRLQNHDGSGHSHCIDCGTEWDRDGVPVT